MWPVVVVLIGREVIRCVSKIGNYYAYKNRYPREKADEIQNVDG